MHITIVANGFQEDYITNILNNLAGKVETIDLIGSTIHLNRDIDSRITIYNLRGQHDNSVSILAKSLRNISYYIRFFIYLLKSKSKIIHVQYFRLKFIEGVLFSTLILIIGKKPVITAHDVLPHSKNNFYYRLIYRLIYRIQTKIVVHTKYIGDRIINEFGINSEKIELIHHGVYQRKENPEITSVLARQKLNLSPSATILLFFGFIAEYKGPELLLQCFKHLEKSNNYQIVFAGKVLPEYKNKFNRLLETYYSDNIKLFIRHIEDKEIELFFKAADITALPYKEASQSGVLFMSYTYGLPVLVPDIGGFPYDVIPNKTGYIFRTEDSESFIKTIENFNHDLHNNSSPNKDFIKNFAKENYSWDKSCINLAKLYYSILED
ncbi:MAG: glycosyltransferase family 4 protein [Bacteroidales bacterium]|nr:glycosyltransferase family 4 protein [Bacteroidales bacterium]